jgi:hypothetical protein
MRIDKQTTILVPLEISSPVEYALKALNRELLRILGQAPVTLRSPTTNQIRLQVDSFPHEEMFRVQVLQDQVLIQGNDGLGLVYGIYHFCQAQLGIDPFEFWTDYPVANQEEINLADYDYVASAPRVRFRGWFINDEDCLIGWHDGMQISLATWERIFETLLRAGYNMVIPGTGTTAGDPQLELASQMGLWIMQHHAEPLGALLFSDAYPSVVPRFPEEKEKFIALYRDAIGRNKGRRVVWALGFRGQGDYPFFKDDERYDTPQKQAALISEMLTLQKTLVEEMTDGPHHFVHYLYSESAELYQAGHLRLDDDIVRVWSDNGFGAMRLRREWGPEKGVPSLPLVSDPCRSLGVYYHLSFHDLQVSAKLAPLVSPELIAQQFGAIDQAGHLDLLLLNVGNIRPHIFGIELIGKLLSSTAETSRDLVSECYRTYTHRHFPGFESEVQMLMERYYRAPFQYGEFCDEKAGEQVYHHTLRNCIKGVLKHESIVHLLQFIPNAPPENVGCFRWLLAHAEESLPGWESLHQDAKAIHSTLAGHAAQYFGDSVRMPIDYTYYSCIGFVSGLRGLLAYGQLDYREAFCLFAHAKKAMEQAWQVLASCEHGKWLHFYRGEWLTDTRETIRQLETIRGMAKIMGDTDTWRSRWMMDALRLKTRSIQTLAQATTDYDRLAGALCAPLGDDADENLSILR